VSEGYNAVQANERWYLGTTVTHTADMRPQALVTHKATRTNLNRVGSMASTYGRHDPGITKIVLHQACSYVGTSCSAPKCGWRRWAVQGSARRFRWRSLHTGAMATPVACGCWLRAMRR